MALRSTPSSWPFVHPQTHPQMIMASIDPAVDAGAVDSAGLTVLHRVAQAVDLPFLSLLLEERHKSQGETIFFSSLMGWPHGPLLLFPLLLLSGDRRGADVSIHTDAEHY